MAVAKREAYGRGKLVSRLGLSAYKGAGCLGGCLGALVGGLAGLCLPEALWAGPVLGQITYNATICMLVLASMYCAKLLHCSCHGQDAAAGELMSAARQRTAML